jgi:uncharacterized membrane protein
MQWFGLLAAPLAWAVQLVFGFGAADANCSRGGAQWGIDVGTWEASLTAAAAVFAVAGEVSAALVFRETDEDDRLHFFATAGLVGNVLFIGLITLTAFGVFTHLGCHQ